MKTKESSQQYLSSILKSTGHAATKAVDDNAEKLANTSINGGAALVNNCASKQGVPAMAVSSSIGFFSTEENKQIIADAVRTVNADADSKIDDLVDGMVSTSSTIG